MIPHGKIKDDNFKNIINFNPNKILFYGYFSYLPKIPIFTEIGKQILISFYYIWNKSFFVKYVLKINTNINPFDIFCKIFVILYE